MNERWLPCFHAIGFGPYMFTYQVSSLGRFKHVRTGRISEGRINKGGYRVIDLHGKTHNAHVVVFKTFRGELPTYMHEKAVRRMEVAHRNHRRSDARLRNLKPLTHSANIRESWRNSRRRAA